MPSLKRTTSGVPARENTFEIYDGDEPRPGVYPGAIKRVTLKKAKESSNQYYNVLVELDSPEDSNKFKYNGYPAWTMITMTDKEANLARERAFYEAICGKPDPQVIFNKLDADENPGVVTKIGGRDPVGVRVRVDLRTEPYQGEQRIKGDSIYAAKDGDVGAVVPEPTDEDLMEEELEDENEEQEGVDQDALREELNGMSLLKLKKTAVDDYELAKDELVGASKADIIDAIIDKVASNGGAVDVEIDEEPEVDEGEGEDEDEDTYESLSALTLPKLRNWLVSKEYDPADVKEMNKAEILEFAVEEELVTAPDSDDPPF